jgi:response regulator RpfG family c-di-GMP phosphodiesterase
MTGAAIRRIRMARIFFLAFNSADPMPLIKKLRNLGHKLIVAEPRYPEFDQILKQQAQPPEIVVCDMSKLASHARETCNYLRGLRSLREAPFLLYNVKPEDEAKTLDRVPGAALLKDDDVVPAIEAALSRRPGAPKPPNA